MEKYQLDVLKQLHKAGYAICVFSPDELKGADQIKVEDQMIAAGWILINAYNWGNNEVSESV
jgi:hypothetical protein